ncbi:MAG: hypothetical protein ACRET1_09215 [Burkholderiales bacterium]
MNNMNNIKFAKDPTSTLRGCAKLARELGLVRGIGTYNGDAFWHEPRSSAIITRDGLLTRAGYQDYSENDGN